MPKSVPIPLPEAAVKNPEIPELENYAVAPKPSFWKSFPSNYPSNLRGGGVNIPELEKLIEKCKGKWTLPEKVKAEKALRNLKGEKYWIWCVICLP